MICGKMQGLLIRKSRMRSAKDLSAARQALRRHVMTCKFCKKHYLRMYNKGRSNKR